MQAHVVVSNDVLPGVALSHKGRWPKLEASAANVNFLNPGEKSDMGESTAVHGIEIEVVLVPSAQPTGVTSG